MSIDEISIFLASDKYHQAFFDYSMKQKVNWDNVSEKLWYICHNVANYIRDLILEQLGTKMTTAENVPFKQFHQLNGIYQIDIKNSYESHSFIANITKDKIEIFNGYGGHHGNPLYVVADREEWINKFLTIESHSLESQIMILNELFAIPLDLLKSQYNGICGNMTINPLMDIIKLY